ncbi:MAG: formylglycine-generating enzyme family protein [Cyanobacteria bacterium P01_C01_bin.120]
MTDPVKRSRLFRTIAGLPPAQFEELLFAISPPAGNVSSASAPQSLRVGELLNWAESPIGCGLADLASCTKDIFGLDVPDFALPAQSTIVSPQPVTETPKVATRREPQAYQADLGNEVRLDMVPIPVGAFWMGSPDKEVDRLDREGPQHRVTVPAFYMGKYPVTQAQWYAVSLLEPVQRELKPQPSEFTGDRRPVEGVNWHDAIEFCQRLSRRTGKNYRLPSEAEWEYACRAGTSTPFYFGSTISSDLANYDSSVSYNDGPTGVGRQQTTEVGQFPANSFDLHDLHGNVWEWCQDVWHDSYNGAPTGGTPWEQGGNSGLRVRRGGSWYDGPRNCRSAYRSYYRAEFRFNYFGFRVVCTASRKQAMDPEAA